MEGRGLRHKDPPALQSGPHTASMAGDSETHLKDRDENTNIIRQPFLIGVSGGTASGKVGTLACLRSNLSHWQVCFIECSFDVESIDSRVLADRVACAKQRSGLIDSSVIWRTSRAHPHERRCGWASSSAAFWNSMFCFFPLPLHKSAALIFRVLDVEPESLKTKGGQRR